MKKSGIKKKRFIILLSVVAIIIGFIVWDFVDAPPFWHFRQADKQAIVQYQRQHYPGAKVVKNNFPLLGNPWVVGVPVESSMTFEYNNVEFTIAAQDGKLTADFFPYSKAGLQIKKTINNFFELHGFEKTIANVNVSFDLQHANTLIYPFDEPPADDLSKYNHRVNVEILVNGKYSSPKEVGWLYDCYQYWISKCGLNDYRLRFMVFFDENTVYNAFFYKDSEVSSEDEFYSNFNN